MPPEALIRNARVLFLTRHAEVRLSEVDILFYRQNCHQRVGRNAALIIFIAR